MSAAGEIDYGTSVYQRSLVNQIDAADTERRPEGRAPASVAARRLRNKPTSVTMLAESSALRPGKRSVVGDGTAGQAIMAGKHFSMMRNFHLADLLTIANGCCGIGAVFQAMRFLQEHQRVHIYVATALIPLAIVLDVLDGRVARWRQRQSAMGREMDSLADLISFGVAPAAIAYAAGLSTIVDQAMLMFFAVCGLSRLARYNITTEELAGDSGKVAYYEGTPIPTSMIPLAILVAAFHWNHLQPMTILGLRFHLVGVLFVLSGSLMVSK